MGLYRGNLGIMENKIELLFQRRLSDKALPTRMKSGDFMLAKTLGKGDKP